MDSDNKINCYLCNTPSSEVVKEAGEFKYIRCPNCTGVFVSPRREQDFYLGNKTYLTDPEDYIRLINPKGFSYFLERLDHFYNKIDRNKGELLEIGAGVGYFAFMAMARGWNVECLETSKESAEWGRKYFHLDIHNETLEKFETEKRYNAIVLIETLEHFLDAEIALKKLKTLGTNKHMIMGSTPNIDSKYWSETRDILVPEDHIFLFNKKSISFLFNKVGYKRFEIDTFGGDKGDGHLFFVLYS